MPRTEWPQRKVHLGETGDLARKGGSGKGVDGVAARQSLRDDEGARIAARSGGSRGGISREMEVFGGRWDEELVEVEFTLHLHHGLTPNRAHARGGRSVAGSPRVGRPTRSRWRWQQLFIRDVMLDDTRCQT